MVMKKSFLFLVSLMVLNPLFVSPLQAMEVEEKTIAYYRRERNVCIEKKDYTYAVLNATLAIQPNLNSLEKHREANIDDYRAARDIYSMVWLKSNCKMSSQYYAAVNYANDVLADKGATIADYVSLYELYVKKGDKEKVKFYKEAIKLTFGNKALKSYYNDIAKSNSKKGKEKF